MSKQAFYTRIKESLFRGKFSQSQVDGLNILLGATEGLTIQRRAYVLATAYHETAHTMQPIYERGPRSYFDKYDGQLGNEAKGDGYRYRGAGYVQLTGKANYAKAGKILGMDLVGHPELATDTRTAARVIVRGMTEGWFTGKKLSDYKTYASMRRIVNGTDRASLIAGYADAFEEALGVLADAHADEQVQVTTGKPVHKSTTNMAAAAAGLSMAASASQDAKEVIGNLGINPTWMLLAIGLAAVGWIFRERIKKAYRDGV